MRGRKGTRSGGAGLGYSRVHSRLLKGEMGEGCPNFSCWLSGSKTRAAASGKMSRELRATTAQAGQCP